MNGLQLTLAEWEDLLEKDTITFTYKNYKGDFSERTVIPERIKYGYSQYHGPHDLCLLWAYDVNKEQYRDFAIKDITFNFDL